VENPYNYESMKKIRNREFKAYYAFILQEA